MSATVLSMSMSLDGFIAGPNVGPGNGLGDDGHRLHDWLWSEPPGEVGIPPSPPGVNGQVYGELLATGAVVVGRETFELAGDWNGDHHDGVPIFVLSRRAPEREWPLVTYTSDVAEAMTRAKEAAGDRNVLVHGAVTAQLALAAGVLDEFEIHVVPVLLGQGQPCSRTSPPSTSSSSARGCRWASPASPTCTTAWRDPSSAAGHARLPEPARQ